MDDQIEFTFLFIKGTLLADQLGLSLLHLGKLGIVGLQVLTKLGRFGSLCDQLGRRSVSSLFRFHGDELAALGS
ncbi:hypothetical protein [Bradyrhizobium zhanjiangense]|uniref:Uncharacterized protein n=1 Tax=Bradyrhizobium zhanjiangense TaxID=1325107 RepID=A0A4Q0SGC6_9BRAD|nr:hypothetical protein [Bradyrhizobium zhanjiangense]RXH38172.1 hypothetical protein XH94_23110 [Bradyrhizobium zhanjiangense]